MGGLGARFTRAKARFFGTAAREIPVPFQVPCLCGHRVAGIRRVQHQVATCSNCGQSIFILPVNVYPATRRVHSEVPDPALAARTRAALRDLSGTAAEPSIAAASPTADASSSTASPSTEAAPPSKDRQSAGRRKSAKGANTPDRPDPQSGPGSSPAVNEPVVESRPRVAPIPRVPLAVRLKRTFSPFRLLVVASLVLLCLTTWWLIQRQRQEVARKTWRKEMDNVQQALTDRDEEVLAASLEKAVNAAHTLNRTDTEVRLAESLLAQCRALNLLTAADPLLALAAFGQKNADRTTDLAQLNAELRGLCLVFESTLTPETDSPSHWLLNLPWIVQSRQVKVLAKNPLFDVLHRHDVKEPVLFMAVIDSCRSSTDGSGLTIELQSDSITLLTSEFLAELAGFDSRQMPELTGRLQRQLRLVTTGDPVAAPEEQPQTVAGGSQ